MEVPTLTVETVLETRKNSLIDTIKSTHRPNRKDSVSPLLFREPDADEQPSGKSSVASNPDVVSGTEKVRRFSRRVSLKPPPNVYTDRREGSKASLHFPSHVTSSVVGHHTVRCYCGRELQVPCAGAAAASSPLPSPPTTTTVPVPTLTLSEVEVTDLKKAFAEYQSRMPPNTGSATPCSSSETSNSRSRQPSLLDSIDSIASQSEDYTSVLKACMDIGLIDDQDSLEVVLSRQNAIKSLLSAMKQYPERGELLLESCKSLLKQVQHSEASLHYLTVNDGIERLFTTMKSHPEHTQLLAIVLDIFGYYSFQDEWRTLLTEKVNPSYFLTTMARHECDVIIVEKCCVVVGNLVLSEDIARSMMYVGGVHSLISMISKYDHNTDILRHSCTALGTFASHDDTCQAVAEAGATCAVMSIMTSFPANPDIQKSCCWALASLSRSDCVCMELMSTDAFSLLITSMTAFPDKIAIQEYGCWALCNLVVLGSMLKTTDSQRAVDILIDCVVAFTNNVELLEHISFAISTIVALKESVHETVVRRDGVTRLIELMRNYEDNVEIQVNGCKVIGNLAVNKNFRCYVEDMGSSEAVISAMLKIDKNASIQNTGCRTLTNLSADCADNKFRILKNGGVHAVLVAMSNFTEDEHINLNALRVLSNLLESDKGCWWIAEESGIPIISLALKKFPESPEIMSFGCTCLSHLPRRGVNTVAIKSVESTLLYLQQTMASSIDVARAVCVFYEHTLQAGEEHCKLLDSNVLEKVMLIMQDFDDIDTQISGCKIMAHIAIRENFELMTRELVAVLIGTMRTFMMNDLVQVVCCGTISYLSSSDKGLSTLQEIWCIQLVIDCMQQHLHHVQIQSLCLMTLENMCRADLVRGNNIQSVCDAVSRSMTTHADNRELQIGCCHILSIIGTGFHKQNEQRRQSADTLVPDTSVSRRRSVTDEIIGVASAAIHRLKRFADDSTYNISEAEVSEVELEPTNYGKTISSVSASETDTIESER